MSGQLVGEVLAASDSLRARGLSERGFHALVAIAEKAQTESRQGSVRWDHIRAGLYGASLSTAKRAIADLKSVGAIRIIRRGFDNQNGRVCAPIYEVSKLTEQVTQVTHSVGDEQVTKVTHSPPTERVISGGRTGQNDDRMGHPGDLLDGSIDGPIDERGRGLRSEPTPPQSDIAAKQTFSPRCPDHIHFEHPPKCGGCGMARKAAEEQAVATEARADQLRRAIRGAIDACGRCDQYGRLDDQTDCPRHTNFRQTQRASA